MALEDKLTRLLTAHFSNGDETFEIQFDPGPPDRVTALVTSSKFEGEREYQRQNMIWDVLEDGLDEDELASISIIIANTPDETAGLDDEQGFGGTSPSRGS